MPQTHENILVIERRSLEKDGLFQGLNFDIAGYLPTLLDSQQHRFVPRPEAENNPDLKQLIPYFVMLNDDNVWCYRRGTKPGEKRLANRYSLGVGGHINHNDADGDNGDTYNRAAMRELNEEIVVPADARHKITALLNDDSNPVGRVHLGVVHVLVTAQEVLPREETIREAGFKTRAELQDLRPSLETWSQIVLDNLDELLKAAKS